MAIIQSLLVADPLLVRGSPWSLAVAFTVRWKVGVFPSHLPGLHRAVRVHTTAHTTCRSTKHHTSPHVESLLLALVHHTPYQNTILFLSSVRGPVKVLLGSWINTILRHDGSSAWANQRRIVGSTPVWLDGRIWGRRCLDAPRSMLFFISQSSLTNQSLHTHNSFTCVS
jgi:hypothetical protein